MVEARIRVIYGDTDQMGVVYHANYFRYFEFSRSEYFRARGGSYREMEREGLALPVVEATASYKSPARYDDVLLVRPRVSEVKRVSLTFTYEIFREGGSDTPLCTGRTVHACVSREGRPTRLPEALVRLLHESP
jgi:acyl-CoA thioester hydrolase